MKKIIISHRANINGKNTAFYGENHPYSVNYALQLGFDVEVDVWFIKDSFYLGHDEPTYLIDSNFFYNDRLWVHAKNIEALYKLRSNPVINLFYHDKDDVTLTNNNFFWTYPNSSLLLTDKSIAVCPERVEGWNLLRSFGICTDYPDFYNKINLNLF